MHVEPDNPSARHVYASVCALPGTGLAAAEAGSNTGPEMKTEQADPTRLGRGRGS